MSATHTPDHTQVLDFWFRQIQPQQWWAKDLAFDYTVRERFAPLLARAAQGELYAWRQSAQGRLAEIIVLDQFSRNMYRDSAAAFAQDAVALVLAQEAILMDTHRSLSPIECAFLFIPLMHSESRLIHSWAEPLYREFAPESNHAFELKHKAIIDRFGRYPHRNDLLGRPSTAEEIEFLKQPGSRF